ncbi:hypothetical protein OG474_37570 [Kribbella sp. NBC_01505]|uniref:hypothetical protein n=1 Tax=Kribbella sp. NBC_01505 TaxID=2903580 RepID=UPI00386EE636
MLKNRGLIASALLVVGLVLLAVGGFVQFHDFTGHGSEEWNLPLGFVAAVLGIAAVVIAWPLPKARIWLGAELAVLSVLLIVLGVANTGFRFVWARDEFELAAFEFLLLLLAVVLIGTALSVRLSAGWPLRVVAYVLGTALLSYLAVRVGTAYYDRTMCTGDDTTDCLALLGGLFWGVGAFVVCLVAIVVTEIVLWRRRRTSAMSVAR